MAVRGTKPTPAAIRLVSGIVSRDLAHIVPPEPEPAGAAVQSPVPLEGYALEEWERVAPQLVAAGMLAGVDLAALAAYCTAIARWRTAEDALAVMAERDPVTKGLLIKTTNGNAIQNPLVGTANKAASDAVRFAAEFGMTPSARTRVNGNPKAKTNKFSGIGSPRPRGP